MVLLPSSQNSILNQFIFELRNVDVQKDSMRFRRNLERIGEIFAYEISKKIEYKSQMVTTPLGELEMQLPNEDIVIASILRAALPFHTGFLNYFDKAENAFVSAFRKYERDGSFDIELGYLSSPDLEGKTLILVDPMLATASSMILSYKGILENGKPKHTHIVSIIASKEGVRNLKSNIPQTSCTIWLGAIDDELTAKSYIVPGLGDAGDLAFGVKE